MGVHLLGVEQYLDDRPAAQAEHAGE
jgi:hypothetical protein